MIRNNGCVKIGGHYVGDNQPIYIIAEVGINHNGDLNIAKRLIDVAVQSGCDAVKFQKRTPHLCVPMEQRNVMRETPWGTMTYMEYRERLEFDHKDYTEIDSYCKKKGVEWFASCWDELSIEFIESFNPPCYKVASATLTNDPLLKTLSATNRPLILSTGMSTLEEIKHAVSLLDRNQLLIAHSTSSYPCKSEELNLRVIHSLMNILGVPVGYSGHEIGLQATYAAVALGACFIERHITLDHNMWGSDQAASVAPSGFQRLVRDIRVLEKALGDGIKKVYDSELPAKARLRNGK